MTGRAALLLLPLVTGCNENMVHQPRDNPYGESSLFADGKVMQAPPDGTVDRGGAGRSRSEARPPITPALLARGAERYRIYCSMCHGLDGRGDGPVPARGFPRPPSYLEARLREAPSAHFFDVITHGYGVMYSYADRVKPADRWAIAAHIRVLQNAQRQVDPPLAR